MADLDDLLAGALRDLAAEAPPLPPLSPRARRRIRVGRAGAVLVTAVVVAGICAGLVAGVQALYRAAHSQPSPSHPGWTATKFGEVDGLAVGESTLYVAAGDFPHATLSAFDRVTGRLIRRIGVPGHPGALHVGPGGLVWLTFGADTAGARSGLWLLSPDLSQRSTLGPRAVSSIDLSDVLPIGPADAVVVYHGLAGLHLPPPGQQGRATLRRIAATPAAHLVTGGPFIVAIVRLAGHYAALVEHNLRYRVVLAGRSHPVFDPGPGVTINSVASGGNGLWITTGPQTGGPSAVIRLNAQLRPATPRSVGRNPDLAFPERVWAAGDTVVVSTDVGSRPLACFRFHNGGAGPVTIIPARLPPEDLAVAGRTLYAADARGVVAYHLPPACL